MAKEHAGDIMPLDIQSPILRIRMIKGLTQTEMALVLDTHDAIISNMEVGTAEINETSQKALTKLGENGVKIASEQRTFIRKQRAWLTRQFLKGE